MDLWDLWDLWVEQFPPEKLPKPNRKVFPSHPFFQGRLVLVSGTGIHPWKNLMAGTQRW